MYGGQQPFRGWDGGRVAESPPQAQSPPQGQPQQLPQRQPQHQHIHGFFPNPNLYLFQQNPSFLPHFNPFLQNYMGFPQIQQPQFPLGNIPTEATHSNGNDANQRPQQQAKSQKGMVEKLDKAAVRAWRDLLEADENVSAWKISQEALRVVKAESWESLGFQMQQVPSLKRLLDTEGKINAFIHCFVAARKITSLHDLEMAICESEGIELFEELELGPFVRNPLAVHYFSVPSDATKVHRIKTEEIITYLCEFIDILKKKEVKVDAFLDFISKKQSVSGKEKLGIRIQSLGLYIRHINKARVSEDRELEYCNEKLRTTSVKRTLKPPPISAQKKEMDDHFAKISERVKSFSSVSPQFCGKHIRFTSSSDDEASEADEYDNNQVENNASINHVPLLTVGLERLSSCPYPSVTEERKRLGLVNDVYSSPRNRSGGVKCTANDVPPRKKRKYEHMRSSTSSPIKVSKRDKSNVSIKHKSPDSEAMIGPSMSAESLRSFVKTWKEACQVNNAVEVLEKMLEFYETRKPRKVKEMFTSYPFVGLLYAAVTYIKHGMLDNIYDTAHDSSAVQPAKWDISGSTQKILAHDYDVAVEDIMKKISEYFEDDISSNEDSSLERRFYFLRKLCKCKYWLKEQYSVKKFQSLGFGEYFVFLEKYKLLLPHSLLKCIIGGRYERVHLEAHLLPIQLDAFLSRAFDSLLENEVNKWNISELLARQFPSVCFKLVNDDLIPSLLDIIREKRHNISSNSVLFSTLLLRLPSQNDETLEKHLVFGNCTVTGEGMNMAFTPKNAIEVLLKAPMLTDLNLWSHWDILFAPYHGPFVQWLLKEVNNDQLLCLITKHGKVIRVDHSTTPDSFLKVLIRGSSFETAVALLSLCALYGGVQNVPLSLLKSHARKGFGVIFNNFLDAELQNDKHPGKPSWDHVAGNSSSPDLCINLHGNKSIHDKAAAVMSRFILECLSYLPVEFCSFVVDILISGLQSFVKDVPSVILNECKQVEQRLVLHEVGISLGLAEWINDHHSFGSTEMDRCSSISSCRGVIDSEFSNESMIAQELGNHKEMVVSNEMDCHDKKGKQVRPQADYADVQVDGQSSNLDKLSKINDHIDNDPIGIVESIRHDEFGLDQCSSDAENKMLEKQHARLGRALQCISRELYSQDSHFLLELVQNADDNTYPKNLEPTLTFILHEKGIIVLNNEIGFSSKDIRALCDIGNSTKKDHNAGYIGKKGIGFKSVFRITDAPEIHSNGYHIKFDITKGQIGFVLPTVVPPRDIDLYTRWAFADADHTDRNSQNTCIVLPFRSNLLEDASISNILSMFSDLHPSLLLFLHRLQCIKFRNMLDNSLIVMRKDVIGDGIVEVALGNEKMTWFVVSQNLKTDVISSEGQTTKISVAFTLQETGEDYVPILKQQPVFAFLPLRTYGLKFILQSDFSLTSSREEVDGNNPWNQWLLSEFPNLFVDAEMSFCNLPCYRQSPGKAITIFMSFVPLLGEVHGFFSSLPRMILSKLRMSNCLILEGDEKEWVPPCKVLRNWTEQTRALLPDSLIQQHLGLGYLNKDVVLSDSLAKALGVEDYGHKILSRVMISLCQSDSGLKSMGFGWLSSWLGTMHVLLSQSFMQNSQGLDAQTNFIPALQKTPFIPLSDGTYSSLSEGTIWLHPEAVEQCVTDEGLLKAFPKLYAKLRIVSPNLLAAASIENSCCDTSIRENVTSMLYKVGVQRLSFHDVVKVHILPAISDEESAAGNEELMTEYLAFAMFHLQSSCSTCTSERSGIIEKLRNKALILTNHGYKRSTEVPIHFNLDYGSSIEVNKLIGGLGIKWHEIDSAYLKHPITKSMSGGMMKWRNFFQDMGVTDFVQVVQVEKSVPHMSLVNDNDVTHSKSMISSDLIYKDWVSEELFNLLCTLCLRDDGSKSKYLLEILDRLWDDFYSDKVTRYCIETNGESKPCKSSFVSTLQDFPWIASNLNDKLHYPKDLFHDCMEVRSVLGVSAPYTIPKVKSERLLADIGLKTQVTLEDALNVLRLWRTKSSFKASLSHMSNFYAFLWKGMAHSKQKIIEDLQLGPSIFVPNTSEYMEEDAVHGVFLSPNEVYWRDPIGSVETNLTCDLYSKMLYKFYPNLHDFFVKECGVDESPPFYRYLEILLQFSGTALPHQAAKKVLDVFLMWDDGLKSGSLSCKDVDYLKESLLKKDYTVLPTTQDKWVSLHESFGLICWCDDDNLSKEFKHLDGFDFLYFGESTDEKNQMLHAKVSTIVKRLGIPALSEIVSREAICYGSTDCSFIVSLLNWVLPYAQRYFYNAQPEKYFQLKQSDFQKIRNLKIMVAENLFYRNVIKKHAITSKKRHDCNCLIQDNILYCSRESDPHSVFLELSCLLFNGKSELQFANFLHMITTMAESGATEEQTEFFILNSQKVPQLPSEESPWSLQNVLSSVENIATQPGDHFSAKFKQQSSASKGKSSSNWPPADWRTAPGFDSVSSSKLIKVRANKGLEIKAGYSPEWNLEQAHSPPIEAETCPELNLERGNSTSTYITCEGGHIEVNPTSPRAALFNTETAESQLNFPISLFTPSTNSAPADLGGPDSMVSCPSNGTERDQLLATQAQLTGRLGELVAYKYFVGKGGRTLVKWVNETTETGLPYDIIIGEDEDSREYIEVKSTISLKKNWFLISAREWQFATEKGESYSVAHVILSENNMAKVTIYKNLAKLCQLGNLKLAMVVPKQ